MIDVQRVQTAEEQAEIARLDVTLERFTAALRSKLVEKVLEGQRGWDDPTNFERMEQEMIVRAMNPYEGHQIDVAAFAMFTWHLDEQRKETA